MVEDRGFIGLAISVGVFKDQDSVTLGLGGILGIELDTVVVRFRDPDPTPVVDVHVGRIGEHGFGSEKCQLEPVIQHLNPIQCKLYRALLLVGERIVLFLGKLRLGGIARKSQ